MYVIVYKPDKMAQPPRWEAIAPEGGFASKEAAGAFAKAGYRSGPMQGRGWIVIPVETPEAIAIRKA
jgi:hypothetical protein